MASVNVEIDVFNFHKRYYTACQRFDIERTQLMSHTAARKTHWIVSLNHRNRSGSFILLFGALGLHLADRGYGFITWLLLALQFLVYPHLVYLAALRSSRMLQTEMNNLMLDSALFGCWVAALGFPLWITFTLLLSVHINLTVFRGLRGLAECLLAALCGIGIGLLIGGARVDMYTAWPTTLVCIASLTLYLLMVSQVSFQRNLSLRKARERLRDSERLLQRQLEEIHGLQNQLREQASRDPLTGLYNRRHLDSALERELISRRQQESLCMLLIDIDHFKQINDAFGHQAGDRILGKLASILTGHSRPRDVICRYGGEEFMILMPNMTLELARQRAESIRQAFAEMTIGFEGEQLQATLSVGLSASPDHAESVSGLIRCADQALYQAKAGGRNKTVVWGPETVAVPIPDN